MKSENSFSSSHFDTDTLRSYSSSKYTNRVQNNSNTIHASGHSSAKTTGGNIPLNEDKLQYLLYELRADGHYELKYWRLKELYQFLYFHSSFINLERKYDPDAYRDSYYNNENTKYPKTTKYHHEEIFVGSYLHARDLRSFAFDTSVHSSEIIVRRQIILLVLNSIRAIILHDRILFLVPKVQKTMEKEDVQIIFDMTARIEGNYYKFGYEHNDEGVIVNDNIFVVMIPNSINADETPTLHKTTEQKDENNLIFDLPKMPIKENNVSNLQASIPLMNKEDPRSNYTAFRYHNLQTSDNLSPENLNKKENQIHENILESIPNKIDGLERTSNSNEKIRLDKNNIQGDDQKTENSFQRNLFEEKDKKRSHISEFKYTEFELAAMEAIFYITMKILEQEIKQMERRVTKLQKAINKTSSLHMSRAFSLEDQTKIKFDKTRVAEKITRVRNLRDTVLNVLDEDDDLELMQISLIRRKMARLIKSRWTIKTGLINPAQIHNTPEQKIDTILNEVEDNLADPEIEHGDPAEFDDYIESHEEVDLLLEDYVQEISSLLNRCEVLHANIESTEELVHMRLATAQNKLLNVTTIFTVMSVYVSCGSAVAGMFGMNLNNGMDIEDDPSDSYQEFFSVTVVTTVLIVFVAFFTYLYLAHIGIIDYL